MSELEISAADLQKKKNAGELFLLIDVREPWEYETCRIEGAQLTCDHACGIGTAQA